MHTTIRSAFVTNLIPSGTSRPMSAALAPVPRRELNNPVTGHRAVICPPPATTSETVEIEFTLPARSAGAPRHIHARFTETFRVVSGRLLLEVGERGHMVVLRAGEAVTIAPGTPHGFRNAFDAEVVFRCTVTPGAGFEDFIRALYGLAADGRTDGTGMPLNFWQFVLILQRGDVLVPGVPVALQQRLVGGLAYLARRCGAERALAPYVNRRDAR